MTSSTGRSKSVFISDDHHRAMQALRAIGKEQTIQHIVDKAIQEYLERNHLATLKALAQLWR